MIVGEYRDDMPRVTIEVAGRAGQVAIEFIVDTAFNGDITLPPDILQQIGAVPNSRVRSRLASGSEELTVAADVTVAWLNGPLPAQAIVYRNNPLLGTGLLGGTHIDIEAVEEGQVLIEPL